MGNLKNKPLLYINYSVTCQEVPSEISLVIDISGCPHHCEGCHSQYLWEYRGNSVSNDLDMLMNKYDGLISCVCFMGGDQNIDELKELLQRIKHKNIKTCLYSGVDDIEYLNEIISLLDYLKVGKFKQELGGLNSRTTNQKMYDIKNKREIFFYKKG